jgi:ergothioneine biosynthesis protein EgtB
MIERYRKVRQQTETICQPLQPEDFVVQPMEDTSPPKWHLGHTTWFFETFILEQFKEDYKLFHPKFSFIFNSYYESVGERVIRANRGNMSRPTTNEIMDYRHYVDEQMEEFLSDEITEEIRKVLETGLQHEQQHQELLLTDLKYILGTNPLFPIYKIQEKSDFEGKPMASWLSIEGGVHQIGYDGEDFHWDNEEGVHKVYIQDFEIQDRLVTNREYLEFIEKGGYQDFQHWLSEAWSWVQQNEIVAPLYWHKVAGDWKSVTLSGFEAIDWDAPVTHISYFEADAFASWKNTRLPSEFEWEIACKKYGELSEEKGNFVEKGILQPQPAKTNQFYGDCWEWTNSAYLPYPKYATAEGALGEYNGKFMINQMVLRGGSCATPFDHIRPTYRNFFPTYARWQYSGIRLAR